MSNPNYIHFGNLTFLEDLYEVFCADPSQVPPSWRYFFEGMGFSEQGVIIEESKDLRISNLIAAYRSFGHLLASFNPVAREAPKAVIELSLKRLKFKESELKELFPTCGLLEKESACLEEIIATLKEIYCGTIGIEYCFSDMPEMEKWLQEKIEKNRFPPLFSIDEKKEILEMLNKSTLFEIFLHTKYVGQKRFSLEGGETLIPILNEIVEKGAELGLDEFVIGMSHRGRLNVLTNILKKSYSVIFSEFEDFFDPMLQTGKGDVKYHKGFSANLTTKKGYPIHLTLPANPSHLESIDPVLEGKVRAKQVWRRDDQKSKIIPILIHGDAAVAGQGVVYETLQLSHLEGYATGGTIHIIINNHIGFTTLPCDSRSTRYPSDIAKAFSSPVFHVNVEDPEGCMVAAGLAIQMRQKFHSDVFIDLNCYRKYGHNEGDEPFFTQPIEYEHIRKKKSVREIYRDKLIQEGFIEREAATALEEKFKKSLHTELEEFKLKKLVLYEEPFQGIWEKYKEGIAHDLFLKVKTDVDVDTLKKLTCTFCFVPSHFTIHPKVEKLFQERLKAVEQEERVDWATAEWLAFASLLNQGIPIRLAGQDSKRGTFSQRHAMWVDQAVGLGYIPLQHLREKQGRFDVIDSLLSEFAALGFEFGYSLALPDALVIWEAQYGDFANGGQVVMDQYISSSEEKWQRHSGLTLLLPHGYEGQGPEHSSARMERYLQLAGNMNMQVVYPSTPAQYFHLLRRQVLRLIRKPLIIFTPKSLLRHPLCTSALAELSQGTFREILDDEGEPFTSPDKQREGAFVPRNIRRLLFCTGKIYYALIEERKRVNCDDVAIMRIEQLFPFHRELFVSIFEKYKGVKECFWVQEEPKNMGAWQHIFSIFHDLLPKEIHFEYVGRSRRAAPAAGSHGAHVREEKQILSRAFEV